MGEEVNIITQLHESTSRDYLARMLDDKVGCMKTAKLYGQDYWDGARRFGYGGYKFIPGRWSMVAQALIERYDLNNHSRILDVGCGKGFLLHEIKNILEGIEVIGLDISEYAISNSHDSVRVYLEQFDAREILPFCDREFDFAFSTGLYHNFYTYEIVGALRELQRVAKSHYLLVESYTNEIELFNLQCWALTANSILHTSEWLWLFETAGYTGDFEFIFFK